VSFSILPVGDRRDLQNLFTEFGSKILLRSTGSALIALGGRNRKSSAINPPIELDSDLTARPAGTIALIEIDRGFDFPDIDGRFKFDELIFAPRRRSMVF